MKILFPIIGFFLLICPAMAQLSVTTQTCTYQTTFANPLTCTFGSSVPAGSFIEYNIDAYTDGGGITSISDSAGDTLVQLGDNNGGAGQYYVLNTAGGTITLTMNNNYGSSLGTVSVVMSAFTKSGFSIDVDSFLSFGGCTGTFSSVTTLNSHDLIVAAIETYGGAPTFTAGTGYTLAAQQNNANTRSTGAATEYREVSSTGTYTPSITISGCGFGSRAVVFALAETVSSGGQIGPFIVGP